MPAAAGRLRRATAPRRRPRPLVLRRGHSRHALASGEPPAARRPALGARAVPRPALRAWAVSRPALRARTASPPRAGDGAATAPGAEAAPRTPRPDPQRGASSIEFAGMLPLLLLVALAAIQLGIAGYAVQQAGTGARAGARTAAQEEATGGCGSTGKAAMSDWTARRATFSCAHGADAVTVTTTVTIPSVIPGIDDFGSAARSVTMPSD